MSVPALIDQIVNHPNSTFAPESASELEMLSESVLRQILLGLATVPEKDTQTTNSSANSEELQNLLEDLRLCQEDLQNAVKAETQILASLQKFGVKRPSVLSYNTTNATVSEGAIQKYLQTTVTPFTVVLNEGIVARRELRSKAINNILLNTSGVYTADDLDRMPSVDLNKLSEALRVRTSTTPQPDYSAMTVADNSRNLGGIFGSTGYGEASVTNDVIDPPKLWT